MPEVVLYSTATCPSCGLAKQLLDRKGVPYREIRVDLDQERLLEMLQRSRRRTVPQIFAGDRHIGGYDNLAELDAAGELDELLR